MSSKLVEFSTKAGSVTFPVGILGVSVRRNAESSVLVGLNAETLGGKAARKPIRFVAFAAYGGGQSYK